MKHQLKKKSVVFILVGSSGYLAGTERVLLDWCKFINPKKIRIIICSKKGNFWDIIKKNLPNVTLIDYQFDCKKRRILRFINALIFFHKSKADKVIWVMNGIKGQTFWELFPSLIITRGNAFLSHHVCPAKPVQFNFKERIDIWLQHFLTRRILAVSDDVKQILHMDWKVPNKKILIGNTGVDIEYFKPDKNAANYLKESFGISQNIKVFIAINRFSKQKRIDRLLGSFLLVLKKNTGAILFITGEGELRSLYEQRVQHNELLKHHVRILGFRQDLPKLLQFSDFLLLASDNEGQSNSIKEAMACEVIPIVTDTPGSKEISNNIFVSSKNVFSFSRQIRFAMSLSPQKISEIKQENLKQIRQRFELKKCCIKNLSVFNL